MIVRRLLIACVAAIFSTSVCLSLQTTTFVGRAQYYGSTSLTKITSLRAEKSKPKDAPTDLNSSGAGNAAAALTDFMAKAHEEKISAMARIEAKYREQINELNERIAQLEVVAKKTTPTSGNSFAFPATNKDLTEKVQAYQIFISDYIVKAQEEKSKAVKAAENKMSAKYEAIIDRMKAQNNEKASK